MKKLRAYVCVENSPIEFRIVPHNSVEGAVVLKTGKDSLHKVAIGILLSMAGVAPLATWEGSNFACFALSEAGVRDLFTRIARGFEIDELRDSIALCLAGMQAAAAN